MTTSLNQDILNAVQDIDGLSVSMIQTAQIDAQGVALVVIEVDPARGNALEGMRQEVERRVLNMSIVSKAQVILTAENKEDKGATSDPHKMDKNPAINIPARNIIVVASGKGGVGKSTVAANLASILSSNEQRKVGLLDADIYGPSQPLMMGDENYKPSLNTENKFIPLERYGVKIMSIGFLVDREKALVWRGPMAQTAFYQLLRDVDWGREKEPLDYLIIDMPPGTGDIQLTLAQKVKVDGAIIVTTPQDIALLDARRAMEMFGKTNVPVIGLVENMGVHVCSNCGHEEYIFGQNGGLKEAEIKGVPFLGSVPLAKNIRLHSDDGKPVVLADPDSPAARAFAEIAQKIIAASK